MRSVLILVVSAILCFGSVQCVDTSLFTYEFFIKEFMQLKSNQKSLQQELKENKEKTLALQNQLNELQKQPDVQWVPWNVNQPIPQHAVFAGYNWDNIPLYVGRTHYNGDDTVVKVCPTGRRAYLSYAGKEIRVEHCEVLTGLGFSWTWTSTAGTVPRNAVLCGVHKTGVAHYIGRAHHYTQHSSSLTPGTVNAIQGRLYIPFGGKEYNYTNYQVLVHG